MQVEPSVIAAILGVGITQIIALIWILSSSRAQIIALTEAVKELKQALQAINEFRTSAEIRLSKIESRCVFYHDDEDRYGNPGSPHKP